MIESVIVINLALIGGFWVMPNCNEQIPIDLPPLLPCHL